MTAIEKLVAALEDIRRMCAKPMKSMDAGSVIDAVRADEIAEEALAEYHATQTTAEVPRCKPWCGRNEERAGYPPCGGTCKSIDREPCYCTNACRAAGHPLNPEVRK